MSAAAGVALVCALALLVPAQAFGLAPHVATSSAPDTCAMCHRTHTAPGDFGVVDANSWEMTRSALGLAAPAGTGDTALCYVCHGIDALGSGTPVGADFLRDSVHSLAPASSPFGPSVKYCSSCHDSHGADEVTPGQPYPRLLRSRTSAGQPVFQGSAYCGTCHTVRPASRFDGVAVYEQTAHYTRLPDPLSGTKVRCLTCHEGHGSAIAPLIVSEIASPAVAATETVTANDRTMCFACHPEPLGVYSGETSYALSAHATSSVLVTVTGEWAPAGAKRRVGECQVCHAPMGADDGSGAPIASLLEMEGSALCLACHDGTVASTDLAALQYPASAAPHPELAAAFSPDATTAAFGTLAVWGTDAAGAAPRDIIGPRSYAAEGTSGVAAAGDLDGDGTAEVAVADRGSNRVTVFSFDPLKGLAYDASSVLVVGGTAEHLRVADIVAGGAEELVVVSAGTLYLYRYDIALGPVLLDTVAGLGSDVTGIATGDLDADGYAEVVVTDSGAPAILMLTESATTPGTLEPFGVGAIPAKAGVRGPSVGDVWAGGAGAGVEIAVANADEATDQVTVYDAGAGTELGSYSVDATAGARPSATLVGDLLPGVTPFGTSRAELVVAIDGGADVSSVNVFPQLPGPGGGLSVAGRQRYDLEAGARSGSLAAGDIDGDGEVELAVGNGGLWGAVPPSVALFGPDAAGSALVATPQYLRAGGAERAGKAPALAMADLGGIGPSRHPVGAVEGAHASTETAPFARHVECADCHNAHEATSTVAAAPAAYGRIRGAFGVTVTNTGPGAAVTYDDGERVRYEYELCFKCHSAYAGLTGRADIAAQLNPNNTSVHAVEAPYTSVARPGSFVAPWTSDSLLYCIDCHTAAGAPPVAGPHTSGEAPVLKRPYLGAAPVSPQLLCYACHRYDVYYTGASDSGVSASWFADASAGPLHRLHVRDAGFGCAACHVSHGSEARAALVRDAIAFTPDASGGTCIGPCHPSPGVTYTR
jgi:predicted CXXCH cytochrome family protein